MKLPLDTASLTFSPLMVDVMIWAGGTDPSSVHRGNFTPGLPVSILAYLDVLLVELGVVLEEVCRFSPGALSCLQVVVVVVSSLHPVLHPVTAVVTWSMNTQRYGHISHQVIYRLYMLIYLAPSVSQGTMYTLSVVLKQVIKILYICSSWVRNIF